MNRNKSIILIVILAIVSLIPYMFCTLPSTLNHPICMTLKQDPVSMVKAKPVILLWTPWFEDKWFVPTGNIECGNVQCQLTDNHTQYMDSQAVVFHGASSKITNQSYYPSRRNRPKHQLWVYRTMENPVATTSILRRLSPFHNNLFHVMMTYAQDADFVLCYGRVNKGRHKDYDPNWNYAKGKTKLIAWIASACHRGRTSFVRQLSKYIPIDMFGKCGNKICKRDGSCQNQLARDYKFYLSFENYICKDYITEKFYRNAINNHVIPIVISGGQYNNPNIIPPHSYINVLDFPTIQDFINLVLKINSSDTLFNSYFKWKLNYTVQSPCPETDSFCPLCNKLHDKEWVIRKSQNPISNLTHRWGYNPDNCIDYPQVYNKLSKKITPHSFKYANHDG